MLASKWAASCIVAPLWWWFDLVADSSSLTELGCLYSVAGEISDEDDSLSSFATPMSRNQSRTTVPLREDKTKEREVLAGCRVCIVSQGSRSLYRSRVCARVWKWCCRRLVYRLSGCCWLWCIYLDSRLLNWCPMNWNRDRAGLVFTICRLNDPRDSSCRLQLRSMIWFWFPSIYIDGLLHNFGRCRPCSTIEFGLNIDT